MRLSKNQVKIITQILKKIAGESTQAYLYGSRINDQAKGGDIDLFIKVKEKISRIEQARIKMELEQALGLPVDIIVQDEDSQCTPFQEIAYANSIKLEAKQ